MSSIKNSESVKRWRRYGHKPEPGIALYYSFSFVSLRRSHLRIANERAGNINDSWLLFPARIFSVHHYYCWQNSTIKSSLFCLFPPKPKRQRWPTLQLVYSLDMLWCKLSSWGAKGLYTTQPHRKKWCLRSLNSGMVSYPGINVPGPTRGVFYWVVGSVCELFPSSSVVLVALRTNASTTS